MPSSEEIMVPVSKPEAMVQAEIHAMRTLADAVQAQGKSITEHMGASTRALEKLGEKVDDMNGRLIRLEEQKHGREIERLDGALQKALTRVDSLEQTRDKAVGAGALVTWLRQTAPWLIAILASGAAVFGVKATGS